jgi:hypothetical protein
MTVGNGVHDYDRSGKLPEHDLDWRYPVGDKILSIIPSAVVSQVAALRRPIVLILANFHDALAPVEDKCGT